MGVSIRLINISGSTSYSVAYSTSPYGSFTTALTGTTSTATISGAPFEFDTQYYIKLTDLVTNRYIIENIYIHDSKAYPLYDTIDFDLSASCVPPPLTPTATPTLTLTQTPTQTLTASIGLTPTATPTLTLTQTPTASLAEPLPGCGDTLTGTYIPTGFTIQTQALDLSEATDESIISVGYVAYDRPNRFNIYGNGMLIEDSGWVGADNTYFGPWGTAGSLTDPDGTGSFTFTYQSGMSYELRVDVGPANPLADPAYPSDGWSVTFTCLGSPTPTPTPTLTASLGQCYTYRVAQAAPVSTSEYGIRYRYPGSLSTDNRLDTLDPGIATIEGVDYFTYSICSSEEPTWLIMTTSTSGTGGAVPNGVYRFGPLGGCSGNVECI
jgi:hypothetical protein